MNRFFFISGHGAGDPGAVVTMDGKEYREADEAEALVRLIAEALGRYDCEVECYDFGRDAYRDWRYGSLRLPSATMMLEVHFNACAVDSGDGRMKGCEAYIFRDENGNRMIAETAVSAVCEAMKLPNRGVKFGQYAVIGAAAEKRLPAALLEVCFLDDADDLRCYLNNRNAVAESIATALAKLFCLSTKSGLSCDEWAVSACKWATENGIVQGDGTDYRWREPVTKEQVVTMLHRAVVKA